MKPKSIRDVDIQEMSLFPWLKDLFTTHFAFSTSTGTDSLNSHPADFNRVIKTIRVQGVAYIS